MGKWIFTIFFTLAIIQLYSSNEETDALQAGPNNKNPVSAKAANDISTKELQKSKRTVNAKSEAQKWLNKAREYTDKTCRDLYSEQCFAIASSKMANNKKDEAMLVALQLCAFGEMGPLDPCNWFLMVGSAPSDVKHEIFKKICGAGNRQACVAEVNKAMYGKNPPSISWKQQLSVLGDLCDGNFIQACSLIGGMAAMKYFKKPSEELDHVATSSLAKSCSSVAMDCLILSSLYKEKGDLSNASGAKFRACGLDPKYCHGH